MCAVLIGENTPNAHHRPQSIAEHVAINIFGNRPPYRVIKISLYAHPQSPQWSQTVGCAGILPSKPSCQNRYGRLATGCQRAVAEPQTEEPPSKRGHAEIILLHSGKTTVCLAQRQRGHAEIILCHTAICHARATPPLRTASAISLSPDTELEHEIASALLNISLPLRLSRPTSRAELTLTKIHTHAKRTISQFVFGRSSVYSAS